MSSFTIFHNPRCSKSRQTLALLEAQGIQPKIVEYLQTPLSKAEIKELVGKLGCNPSEILRSKEAILQEMTLDFSDEEAIIAAMVKHPILIERPIVVHGDKAVVGRPPENIKELF
ncbi:MAG: arsenate reductase (glutaredoxin) [Deltaproteobacteria bacterium]|nr:arsenate reductase (glutaredoxin) [Deltaproteobacteria bacterium]